MKSKRAVRLLTEATEDKAWAAVVVLGGYTDWVSIDDVGDFLRMRQLDAAAVGYRDSDPNTRYALRPRITKWQRGWEDAVIARALSEGVNHGFLDLGQREGLNVFRAKKDVADSLWKLQDTSTPISPTWALPRDIHVEA